MSLPLQNLLVPEWISGWESGKIHSSPVVRDPNLLPNYLGSGNAEAARIDVDVLGEHR